MACLVSASPMFRGSSSNFRIVELMNLEMKYPPGFIETIKTAEDLTIHTLNADDWTLSKSVTCKRLFEIELSLDHKLQEDMVSLHLSIESCTGHSKDLLNWFLYSFDLYLGNPKNGWNSDLATLICSYSNLKTRTRSGAPNCSSCKEKTICFLVYNFEKTEKLLKYLYVDDSKTKMNAFLSLSLFGGSSRRSSYLQTPLHRAESSMMACEVNLPLFHAIKSEKNVHSDVVVVTSDRKTMYFCHRSVLFACSLKLDEAVKSVQDATSMSTKPFELMMPNNVTSEITYYFLEYVYLKKVDVYRIPLVIELIKLAVKYDIFDLHETCTIIIYGTPVEEFDPKSTIELFFMKLPHDGWTSTKPKAISAFQANANRILHSEEYNNLLDSERKKGLSILSAIFSGSEG